MAKGITRLAKTTGIGPKAGKAGTKAKGTPPGWLAGGVYGLRKPVTGKQLSAKLVQSGKIPPAPKPARAK